MLLVIYRATWRTFLPQSQNFSLKSFLYFLLKKPLKKFLIFSQKNFSIFKKTELSYIFLKKVFLCFGKGMFRAWHVWGWKRIWGLQSWVGYLGWGIWGGVGGSGGAGQSKGSLISTFACFLTAAAGV